MPPHNLATIARARTLAHVLIDLREAKRDADDALEAYVNAPDRSREEAEADDRRTEAETRVEDLRDEFATLFVDATGLTWAQIEAAMSEAVL
jgi:hypothetical protein